MTELLSVESSIDGHLTQVVRALREDWPIARIKAALENEELISELDFSACTQGKIFYFEPGTKEPVAEVVAQSLGDLDWFKVQQVKTKP